MKKEDEGVWTLDIKKKGNMKETKNVGIEKD